MSTFKIFIAFLLFILFSCSNENENSVKQVTDKQIANAMNDSISMLLANANFVGSIYENATRVKAIETQLKTKPNDNRLKFQYARELLNNGDTQKAIDVITSLIASIPAYKVVNDQSKIYYEFLAVCYLRLGEQKNCQENHTAASCIVPIANSAIHKFKEGSEKAIELYNKILNIYPDDDQSKWLLNVAYMTLGRYPRDVPSKFLIELPKNKSDLSIKNIAGELGIDGFGLSGGSIAEDFNNDGFVDILSSTWGTEGRIFLFQNDGKGGFNDVTSIAGLGNVKGGLNLVQTDYNNDGLVDIYIMRSGWMPIKAWGIMPNSLLKNNGDGTFSDVTVETGLYSVSPSQSVSWFDFDNDGDLDLFVANETNSSESYPCELFVNTNSKFKNEAAKFGLNRVGYFKGVTVSDLNNDGFQDIYISNLKGPNLCFVSSLNPDNSLKGYKEAAIDLGIEYPMSAFPCWTFDVNNDGNEDVYVASYDALAFKDQSGQFAKDMLQKDVRIERNFLYLNNGDNTFRNATSKYFRSKSLATMGSNYGDINNDGFLDFYLGTGAPDYRAIVPNRLFVNDSGQSFKDVTFSTGVGHIQKGHAISFADFDNDGDQDIYAVMGGAFKGDKFPNVFYNNELDNDNKWLKLNLKGVRSNRLAIGARLKIEVRKDNGEQRNIYHKISSGASFGANCLMAEIGLGNAKEIISVQVNWPNGLNKWVTYDNIDINSLYSIEEGGVPQKGTLNLIKWDMSKPTKGHHHHH